MENDSVFTYREIGTEKWYRSLPRQLREWNIPPVEAVITADPDPAALDLLIDHRSPWQSIARHVKERFEAPVARFEPTADPVELPENWSIRNFRIPGILSVFAHATVVLLLFVMFVPPSNELATPQATWVPLYLPSNLLVLPEETTDSGGGGGGGNESLTVPSLGEPPRASDQQFVPPSAEPPKNTNPILVMEPTIVAPQLAALLSVMPPILGDPFDGIPAPPTSGPGVGGGIADGQGTGVGPGQGTGLGPGTGAGFGDGVYEVGGGVSMPSILSRIDPVYSEDARRARYEGTVILEAIVRKDGTVEILRVVRSLGFGLDEQAIVALKEWKFRPAMRSGVPVDVAMNIQVNFNLH